VEERLRARDEHGWTAVRAVAGARTREHRQAGGQDARGQAGTTGGRH
jgi:hypothetical protein